MAGVSSSSAKMKVLGEEVALVMRFARKRGDADAVVAARWTKG